MNEAMNEAMNDAKDGSAVEAIGERMLDLEVRIAYQDRLVRELDALVRQLADRLDKTERELKTIKQSMVSPEGGVGPANERPPHY